VGHRTLDVDGEVENTMTSIGRSGTTLAKRETTRRSALKVAGGAALFTFAHQDSQWAALAEDASPVAASVGGDALLGKQLVIRMRALKPDRSAGELMAMIEDGFLSLMAEIPGFVWYVAVANPETRSQFSIGIFADETGVAESNRRAAEWGGQSGAADFVEGDPTVFEGAIEVAAEPLAPAAGLVGMQVAIRLRQANPDWPVDKVMALIAGGYVPLVEELPGFMAYFGSANPESGAQAYVVVFDDKTGTVESTRVAGEWLTANGYDFFEGDPTVAEGIIGAAAGAG
jgi:hypothetical protein